MRYSILKVTVDQVKSVGGINIKEMPNVKVIYADLTDEQKIKLATMGAIIAEIRQIKVSVMPPPTIAAIPTYTPQNVVTIAKFDDVRNLTVPPLSGVGVNVAIIGTGIRETHQLINGSVVYRKNYTASPMGDGFNHDTGTCSIILAVAPQCNILNLKVMDSSGNGTEEEVVLAIDDLIDMVNKKDTLAPSIINLSFGAPDSGDSNDVMRVICRAAINAGIWVVAAAGNSGPNTGTIMSPACEQYVLAIGSAKLIQKSDGNYTFQISDFSSRGPTVDGLVKPDAIFIGEDINMASSVSDSSTIAKSGTSFSTPFCTGLCILYLQNKVISVQSAVTLLNIPISQYALSQVTIDVVIDEYLKYFSIKPSGVASGKDNGYGYGLPFGDTVVKLIKTLTTPTLDISSIISAFMPMIVITGFSGMMDKMFTKK